MKKERWVVSAKRADFQAIADRFGIDPVIARLIRNRDVTGEKEIEEYLFGDLEQLHDPLLMKDMERAADLIAEKIREKKPIRIIGDYDIDGVTATYILLTGLKDLGADVDVRIPDRIADGYGLNEHLVQFAADEGRDTIVTCDNGIAAGSQIRLAKELPEYETVHAMFGVGELLAAQLMAEIGDIRNYPRRSSLVGFAGVDPEVNQSGKMNSESNPSTKRGSPHLRKTLFQLMTVYLRLSPADEAVYQFLDKKRSEGKPYYVYMTAGANKFLRIYYARVKECMAKLETPAEIAEENG